MVLLIASLALVTGLADGQLRGVGGRERHRVHLRARLPSVRAVTAEALDEAARRRAGSIPQPGPGEITHQWVPLVVHRRHAPPPPRLYRPGDPPARPVGDSPGRSWRCPAA